MSSPSNPQHEPTMEEILASIRRIISEDQPEAANAELAVPGPSAPEPPQAAPPPPAAEAEVHDVLELTEEVHGEPQPAPPPEPVLADDIAFAPRAEPVEIEEQEHREMDSDELISDSTRDAVGKTIDALDSTQGPAQAVPLAQGGLDALFVQAVRDALGPVVQEWVDEHAESVLDQLKPLIREWMDQNLPDLIETAVRREISRRSRR